MKRREFLQRKGLLRGRLGIEPNRSRRVRRSMQKLAPLHLGLQATKIRRFFSTLDAKIRPPVSSAQAKGGEKSEDRKSTRLNSSHGYISYAVFCLKKKND